MTGYNPADQATALGFAASVRDRDYETAARMIAHIVNAGNPAFAAELLGALVEAGVAAVEERARQVTVHQKIGTVPEGTTVIGYQGGRIGR